MTKIIDATLEQLHSLASKIRSEDVIRDLDAGDSFFHTRYYLALDSYREVGAISIRFTGAGEAEIFKLFVPSERRRKGIANRLVEHAINDLSSSGITTVYVEYVGDSHLFWSSLLVKYRLNEVPGEAKFWFDLGQTEPLKVSL